MPPVVPAEEVAAEVGHALGKALSAYRFYRFRPRRMKLFDETSLGGGVFVLATVRNGQVAWERTEVYRPEVTPPA